MPSRKKVNQKRYGAIFKGQETTVQQSLDKKDIKRVSLGTDKKGKQRYKYVSKKKSAEAKKNPWIKAVKQARKELGIEGFVIMNKGPEGKRLYDKAKELYETKFKTKEKPPSATEKKLYSEIKNYKGDMSKTAKNFISKVKENIKPNKSETASALVVKKRVASEKKKKASTKKKATTRKRKASTKKKKASTRKRKTSAKKK